MLCLLVKDLLLIFSIPGLLAMFFFYFFLSQFRLSNSGNQLIPLLIFVIPSSGLRILYFQLHFHVLLFLGNFVAILLIFHQFGHPRSTLMYERKIRFVSLEYVDSNNLSMQKRILSQLFDSFLENFTNQSIYQFWIQPKLPLSLNRLQANQSHEQVDHNLHFPRLIPSHSQHQPSAQPDADCPIPAWKYNQVQLNPDSKQYNTQTNDQYQSYQRNYKMGMPILVQKQFSWLSDKAVIIELVGSNSFNIISCVLAFTLSYALIAQVELQRGYYRMCNNKKLINMGNKPSENTSRLAPHCQNLEIINQFQLCQVVASSNTHYLLRQLSFNSMDSLSKCYKWLRQLQNNAHPTITSLLHIQQKIVNHMCGSEYKLRLFFQHSQATILDQISARKINKEKNNRIQYFDFADACRIVAGCLRALARVQQQLGSMDLEIGTYNRIFLNPERVLIMDHGLIKIVNPLAVSPYDRFHHRHNSYYSPQKLSDFDFPQDEKSQIFELGLTLLHILTLQDCKDIYNGFQVKQDEIDKRILQIYNLYHETFLCQLLSKMTRTFRPFRSGLRECISMIQLLEQKLEFKQVVLNTRYANQIESLNSWNSEQKPTKSKLSLRNPTQKSLDINVLDYDEQDKQNIMMRSNKESQSLKYSQFTGSPDYKYHHILPNLMNLSNLAPQIRKQSCIITNQSPHYNIAMITSSSLANKTKQSYCYGQQLSEGLLPTKKQIGTEVDESANDNGNRNIFEWKRIQFNKKYKGGTTCKDMRRRVCLEDLEEMQLSDLEKSADRISLTENQNYYR